MKKVFFKKFFDFYTIDEYLDFADKSQSVNLILGFDDFSLLDEVGPIDKLIITSGDASTAHYDALYRHSEIKGLTLDYYEDESFSPWTVDLSFSQICEFWIVTLRLTFVIKKKKKNLGDYS